MVKLISRLKDRWELYAGAIVIAGGIVWQGWGIEGRVMTEQKVLRTEVTAMKEAYQQDDQNDAALLDAKLAPIIDGNKELKQKVAVLKANLDGLTVAATHGAGERAAQLEGRLVVLQNQMMNQSVTQQDLFQEFRAIRAEIEILKALASTQDTVLVVSTDTLIVRDGKWWNPFD